MSVDHTSTIDANKDVLLAVLRVSDLLLTELCGEDVLDERTKQVILAGGIQYDINERFLDWLKQSQPSTFTVCLEKLRDDQQNHIANLLDGTPGERPLTREKRQQIQKNIRHLSEIIEFRSGLLIHLYSKSALSLREQQEIESENVTGAKAMKLLQLILEKSDRTLNCFVEALKETNQANVVCALEKGDIVPVRVEVRSTSDRLHQFEGELINILEPFGQEMPYCDDSEGHSEDNQPIIDGLEEIWRKRIKFLRFKQGNSITIYFWCESVEAMAELYLMYETRHLEHILEKIFNLVKTSVKIPNVMIRVTMSATDLQILQEAVQLNKLTQIKSKLAEGSLPESSEGKELHVQPPSSQTKSVTELDLRQAKLQTKDLDHGPEEAEPEIKMPELPLNAEMHAVATENIRLKKILEATEQDKSKLKQQLLQTQNENTDLREQLEKAKTERDQIRVLQLEIEQQQFRQCASVSLQTINTENLFVLGVTYLKTNIYLLLNQHIVAYQRDSPYLRNIFDDIDIAEIEGPKDIAACHGTSSLYITDHAASCVWQTKVDGSTVGLSIWLTNVGQPFSLSVTEDARVLIPRSKPEPCLDVYDSRAGLMNNFPLPVKSWKPLHAVETMNGNFVISFWSEDVMDEYGICELDGKGKIIRRPAYDTVGFESSVYMAPGDDNWVFAARPEIGCVTLFEKQFFCDVITYEKDDIYYPRKLCYIRGKPGDWARLVIIYGEEMTEVAICSLPNAWHCHLKNCQYKIGY